MKQRASVDAEAEELVTALFAHPETSDILLQNHGWQPEVVYRGSGRSWVCSIAVPTRVFLCLHAQVHAMCTRWLMDVRRVVVHSSRPFVCMFNSALKYSIEGMTPPDQPAKEKEGLRGSYEGSENTP